MLHNGLAQGEGGDEQTGVERGIFLVAEFELLDEGPGVRKDGGESDGFGKANNGQEEQLERGEVVGVASACLAC